MIAKPSALLAEGACVLAGAGPRLWDQAVQHAGRRRERMTQDQVTDREPPETDWSAGGGCHQENKLVQVTAEPAECVGGVRRGCLASRVRETRLQVTIDRPD